MPIGIGDTTWKELLPDFAALDHEDEVIISAVESLKSEILDLTKKLDLKCEFKFIESKVGRASQLNNGASLASKEYLWFLHCDSRLNSNTILRLNSKLKENPNSLFYFDLDFANDGTSLLNINKAGAWFRSHVLRLPFGDQGFAMSREIFKKLNGFPESVLYGEDHLFVWKAHKQGVAVDFIGEKLVTSARKYSSEGWAKTTSRHLWLTFKQGIPQAVKLIAERTLK